MNSRPFLYVGTLCWIFLTACTTQQETIFSEKDINLIPIPNSITLQNGAFVFDDHTQLVISEPANTHLASVLIKPLENAAGISLEVVDKVPESNFILLEQANELPNEHYALEITSDRVIVKASSYNGFLYGLESLRQLLPPQIESKSQVPNVNWTIPNASIVDGPSYSWRGLMLDVSRHFFEKNYVMEVIDELAFHKMNKLHLHLVDDQGWRIEIKKYPKLTSIGAYRVDQENLDWNARRTPELGEKATFGGFYTQEDIQEIVAYATEKGIEVIPEIEMPAHVMSAIASYPELSCFGDSIMVPSGGIWPITEIYCAGKESTFEFLENVLEEIMPLFPSQYIHVGGDEATKTNWEKCPYCQKRIKDENLKDVHELQSYFMKRMEKFLLANDKRMIGWDEILEGGLAPEATVMSWRGFQGGWEAAKQGHDVIMTPTSYCYFDYYQGPQDSEPVAFNAYTPLSQVYQFNPVLDSMDATQKSHILGGQANLWSEFIPTTKHSEYMIYPRIAALSEALWSSENQRDWNDFSKRIQEQFKRYEYAGLNYAKSAYSVMAQDSSDVKNQKIVVKLNTEFPNADIRFITGEADLDENAIKYSQGIVLEKSAVVKAAVFRDGKANGAVFTKSYHFHKAFGKQITFANPPHSGYKGESFTLVDGLNGSKDFHDGKWQAWLNQKLEATIDLETEMQISTVLLGSMESQGSGINFPTGVTVLLSSDGTDFHEVASMDYPFQKSAARELKNFELTFEQQKARYVKVIADNNAENGGGSFIFFDELIVN